MFMYMCDQLTHAIDLDAKIEWECAHLTRLKVASHEIRWEGRQSQTTKTQLFLRNFTNWASGEIPYNTVANTHSHEYLVFYVTGGEPRQLANLLYSRASETSLHWPWYQC